eukprot:gene9309-12544_t
MILIITGSNFRVSNSYIYRNNRINQRDANIFKLQGRIDHDKVSGAIRTGGPPLNIEHDRHKEGQGENGIRQITRSEVGLSVKLYKILAYYKLFYSVPTSRKQCQQAIQKFLKSSKIASGSSTIERLELLLQMDKFSEVMPGWKRKRIDLLAFGSFIEGRIECIGGVCWKKKIFPSEMELVALYCDNSNNASSEQTYLDMISFIDQICKDNAILADYSPLLKYDLFKEKIYDKYLKNFTKSQSVLNNIFSSISNSNQSFSHYGMNSLEDLILLYLQINKSPSICLSDTAMSLPKESLYLGHYWFHTCLHHNKDNDLIIDLYFRQKKGRDTEYEILFRPPEVGTKSGSGTVGNPLIIHVDSTADEIMRDISLLSKNNSSDTTSSSKNKSSIFPFHTHQLPSCLDKQGIRVVSEALCSKIRHPQLFEENS